MFQIIRAVFLSTFWWWVALAALLVGYSSFVRADHPEERKIRAALDANFEAYNKEDVKAIMATLSPTMPGREQFAQEAAATFAGNDAYISVRDFELLGVRGQFAAARVVQGTTVRDGGDDPTQEQAFYRENSKLLPSEEVTEYVQSFKRENGKWRLWLIMTPATSISPEQENGVNVRSDCPNGNCGFPRVRVVAR